MMCFHVVKDLANTLNGINLTCCWPRSGLTYSLLGMFCMFFQIYVQVKSLTHSHQTDTAFRAVFRAVGQTVLSRPFQLF